MAIIVPITVRDNDTVAAVAGRFRAKIRLNKTLPKELREKILKVNKEKLADRLRRLLAKEILNVDRSNPQIRFHLTLAKIVYY